MYQNPSRSTFLFIALSTLIAVSLACGSGSSEKPTIDEAITTPEVSVTSEDLQPNTTLESTDTPQPTIIPPTPTLLPIGFSRGSPYLISELVSAPNWDVQVLEVLRGDVAWQSIQAANQFNEPPPEGMEYLLVKIHAKSTYADTEEHTISRGDFKITGDRLIEYFTSSVVTPEPQLDGRLFTGGEIEGWSAYLVGQGEGNLILVIDEILNFDENRNRYIALDDGASITVSPELAGIQLTILGEERSSPASHTEKVITEDWEINVLEIVRGTDVWTMLQAANQFNDPPSEGMEYILVKVHIRYIGINDSTEQLYDGFFKSTGSANVLYDSPSVVEPSPVLDAVLYPGGISEGWVTVQMKIGEGGVLLVFEPLLDFSGENTRYISLEP